MKNGFMIILAVACCYSPLLFAQGPDYCEQCACVADNSCTTGGACSNTTGCAGVTVTANCGNPYTLKVVLKCPSNDACEDCFGCAILVHNADTVTIATVQAGCDSGSCEDTLAVNLTQGHQYTLYACLKACAGHDCRECASCTVRAFVFKQPADCDPMPPCDP